MADDVEAVQDREWDLLYGKIREVLRQFGEEDVFEWTGDRPGYQWKDYLVVDENAGTAQHKVETQNLEMVRPVVIKALQRLLAEYPNWEIVIAVGSATNENWPSMGLVIRSDEIIDGLQRQFLPEEFQTIEYDGSRPQGSRFSDLIYSLGSAEPIRNRMTDEVAAEQTREWGLLYHPIRQLLQQFGEEGKDYTLVEENLGLFSHRIWADNVEILKPVVVKSLQKLLTGYPNWEIVITAFGPKGKNWPAMGVIISDSEIIDGLQRQYLPKEFQRIEYEGSRPQGPRFSDVIALALRPF